MFGPSLWCCWSTNVTMWLLSIGKEKNNVLQISCISSTIFFRRKKAWEEEKCCFFPHCFLLSLFTMCRTLWTKYDHADLVSKVLSHAYEKQCSFSSLGSGITQLQSLFCFFLRGLVNPHIIWHSNRLFTLILLNDRHLCCGPETLPKNPASLGLIYGVINVRLSVDMSAWDNRRAAPKTNSFD